MPNLQQIADALSGFGAGTQGQGGQFAESMARRAAYAQQEKQRIEDLDKERISMMVKDAWMADKLLNENKPEVTLRMLQNRVENIKRLGGDPSHTQEVIDGLTSGDPARVAQTRQDVKLFADAGIAYGAWAPPQPKIKEAKWVDGIGWTGITEGGQMVAPENTPEFQSKIAEAQKQSMKMNDYQRISAAQRQQEIEIQQKQLEQNSPQNKAALDIATANEKAKNEQSVKTQAAQDQAAKDNQTAYNVYQEAVKGLTGALSGTTTGKVAGALPAITTSAQVAEGATAAMAPVLKQLFRTAGEGSFSDSDQKLLMQMIPTRSDNADAVKAKIENINNIVQTKLGMKTQSSAADRLAKLKGGQ